MLPPPPLTLIATATLFLLVTCCCIVNAGVPIPRYEALLKQQSAPTPEPKRGLYNSSDKVTTLRGSDNFRATVLQQNRSTLVEFYNSFCGHCKRFAPHYKNLADQLDNWREALIVAAIDCADEANNDICRSYEIMAYPTMRYFGPAYTPSEGAYGHTIDTQDLDAIRISLAQSLAAEQRSANWSADAWPNLDHLTKAEAETLFEGVGVDLRYVVLVYDMENSTLGIETVLHLLRWRPQVLVRRITEAELAAQKFQLDGARYKLAIIDASGTIVPYAPLADTSKSYAETVESFLRSQQMTERPNDDDAGVVVAAAVSNSNEKTDNLTQQQNAVLVEVQRGKHVVYQADLELAVRGVLFNEIPKLSDISGERLLALQRFLAVLQRYNPMGAHGRALITQLNAFVLQFNQQLTGKTFEMELLRLETQLSPIFSARHFVGCAGSRAGLRGFTCSLWQLFHFMTVQAAREDLSQDPLEVLQAMHGYVKFFFGCTECSEHFQSMATRRKIWSTPNKDEAVLWLWSAHNEVNQRLAGDTTEDSQFPKKQFPSSSSCPQCYKQPATSPATLDINWDKDEVLSFLKNIHNPESVSRYGIEREDLLQPTLEKLRQKRMIGNVFSDMDMRMGMLLYGFCIVMMVVAFKLFAFKGYRKKPYGHDLLGKV